MADEKRFYQGTDNDYDTYQSWVSDPVRANIPDGGKVMTRLGFFEPNYQKVTEYSAKISHPSKLNDCIWEFGDYQNLGLGLTEFTLTEAIANGYISNDDPSSF